jgi:hypothetical protein
VDWAGNLLTEAVEHSLVSLLGVWRRRVNSRRTRRRFFPAKKHRPLALKVIANTFRSSWPVIAIGMAVAVNAAAWMAALGYGVWQMF